MAGSGAGGDGMESESPGRNGGCDAGAVSTRDVGAHPIAHSKPDPTIIQTMQNRMIFTVFMSSMVLVPRRREPLPAFTSSGLSRIQGISPGAGMSILPLPFRPRAA